MKNLIATAFPLFLLSATVAIATVPPDNDYWTDPIPISGDDIEISGSNVGATDVGPEWLTEHGVWYKWSPEESGAYEISTDGSSFDTFLMVYIQTAGEFGSFQDRAQNDNRDDSTTASAIRIKLFEGVDYRFLVGSPNFGETGDFKLQVKRLPRPLNDTVEGATVLTGEFPVIFDENTPATSQPGENGDSLWYRWTAPRDATYRISTAGSEFFSNMTVFSGPSASDLTEIAYTDDAEGGSRFAASVDLPLTSGTQYWFRVSNPVPTDSGKLQLSIAIPPSNDAPENAITLSQDTPVATGDNRGAIIHRGEFGYHGVWFKWTSPQNGGYSFATVGSEIDTVLAIHTGTPPDDLKRVGRNDNDVENDTITSRVDLNTVAGETYWIAIAASDEGEFGEVRIRIDPIPGPPNDTAGTAFVSDGERIVERSNINGATSDAGERGSYGVWYRWTAPQSGPYRFSTARSSFDTLLTVYTGSSASNLTELDFNDDSPENPENNFYGISTLVLPVESGTTYWILVSGADDAQSGRFSLAVDPVPANDTPENAIELAGLDPESGGNNSGAIGSPDENGVQTVWYRWTAPMSREYKIQLTSPDFDTILTLFEGPDAANLVELGFNDDDWDLDLNDWGSGLTILAEEGDTFWFMVSAKFEGQTGAFTIAVIPGVFPQTFEEWIQTELVDYGVTTGIGPEDDHDADGLVHLVEYAFGLNPRGRDATDHLRMGVTVFGDDERVSITYERRKAATAPGLTYAPEFSGDQVNWSGDDLDEFVESLNTVWEKVRVRPNQTPDGQFKTGRVLISLEP